MRQVRLPDGRRAYRTGDRARLTRRGTIELIGRLDAQVKIRGQRVELEGLEAVLAEAPFVWQCMFAYDQATGILGAVVAPHGSANRCKELTVVTLAMVREHMAPHVPPYCLPQCLHLWANVVEGFPTTCSGKCDRQAINAWMQTRAEQERQQQSAM
jgi:acyl-coenzyme A synthetase/AMP-(fatty) acid ligase